MMYSDPPISSIVKYFALVGSVAALAIIGLYAAVRWIVS